MAEMLAELMAGFKSRAIENGDLIKYHLGLPIRFKVRCSCSPFVRLQLPTSLAPKRVSRSTIKIPPLIPLLPCPERLGARLPLGGHNGLNLAVSRLPFLVPSLASILNWWCTESAD